MSDKIQGTIALLVGIFAIGQGYWRHHLGIFGWQPWGEVAAGVILILLSIWWLRRKPSDSNESGGPK